MEEAYEKPGRPQISLTSSEANLREFLLDVGEYINRSTGPHLQNTVELRFAGGWVRDKLLGVVSHDIDVAINRTGEEFGDAMKEYVEELRGLRKNGKGPDYLPESEDDFDALFGELHKIKANPEKSKHLETITTHMMGLSIDLVNLRKETYAEDSRTPQMQAATPEEDALRRDATINALFYNLHSSSIEDFTGRGLSDMRNKILRTPLNPYTTFMDDPLRILRLIRFASRLNYTIDPVAEVSMESKEIQEALRRKISRERVGEEIKKMLTGGCSPYI